MTIIPGTRYKMYFRWFFAEEVQPSVPEWLWQEQPPGDPEEMRITGETRRWTISPFSRKRRRVANLVPCKKERYFDRE